MQDRAGTHSYLLALGRTKLVKHAWFRQQTLRYRQESNNNDNKLRNHNDEERLK